MILEGKGVGGPVSARITVEGRQYLNFFGTAYLALSGIPEIRGAVRRALDEGVAFARHLPAAVGGDDPIFDAVEAAGATALDTEASVYFASGAMIGSVGLASLAGRFGSIAIDECAHYSLQEAALASGVCVARFSHRDVDSLAEVLETCPRRPGPPLVMTDGIFAATGAIAPLAEYATLLRPLEGAMLVDESHGFGVVGSSGRGAWEHCGLDGEVVRGATMSKAYCAHGGLVGCTSAVARMLRERPPVRGSSSGSPLSAVAAAASLRYVAAHPELRLQLAETTRSLREHLRDIGLEVIESPAPIVSFRVGSRADMLELQRRLFERGICVHHSTYIGAGPEGLIRCAVYRDHSTADIEAFAADLGDELRAMRLAP